MQIKKQNLCGAKAKHSGLPCTKPAVEGQKRCKYHGGIVKIAGADSVTARPGGIYSQFYTAEELLLCAGMELGSVDAEIALARIRLARALKLEALDAAGYPAMSCARGKSKSKAPLPGEELETRKETFYAQKQSAAAIKAGEEPTMQKVQDERHYKKIDYRRAIISSLNTIESLERTRAELAKAAQGNGNEDLVTALAKLADRLPA